MKCPQCLQGFHETWNPDVIGPGLHVRHTHCPECNRKSVQLGVKQSGGVIRWRWVYPAVVARMALPEEVPGQIVDDYREAEAVLALSAKASAALSRRNLQRLLRKYGDVNEGDLYNEIEEVIPKVPPYLADALHGVREIGKFAAHPIKSKSTGEIVDVEPNEAEWLLETVGEVIAFYIVTPLRAQARMKAIADKVADAEPRAKRSNPPAAS